MVNEIVEVKRNETHLNWKMVKVQCTTHSGDWVVLDDVKGVIPMRGMSLNINRSGGATPTWGVATCTNTLTATTTSMPVTAATITRTGRPFYIITAGDEICEVLADSAPTNAASTWTIRRGCLGTTASATGLAATNVVGIMNIVFCAAPQIGPHIFPCLELPNDYRYT